MKTGANAFLAIKPYEAQEVTDVRVRIGEIPLPTLCRLKDLQTGGLLNRSNVNEAVWLRTAV